VPTIGIGALGGVGDGQILVTDDMLGVLRLHAEIRQTLPRPCRDIRGGARDYADEVRRGAFPAAEHTYRPNSPR